MTDIVWTTLHIALHKQPDGTERSLSRFGLKGAVSEAELIERAITHIKADRDTASNRNYLLNCIDCGNYRVEVA
jgi:hypothetical protein